ncbi:hypothetical protein OAR19_00680, partial [bacterium]|nr:hypothetical protein [bacterium]
PRERFEFRRQLENVLPFKNGGISCDFKDLLLLSQYNNRAAVRIIELSKSVLIKIDVKGLAGEALVEELVVKFRKTDDLLPGTLFPVSIQRISRVNGTRYREVLNIDIKGLKFRASNNGTNQLEKKSSRGKNNMKVNVAVTPPPLPLMQRVFQNIQSISRKVSDFFMLYLNSSFHYQLWRRTVKDYFVRKGYWPQKSGQDPLEIELSANSVNSTDYLANNESTRMKAAPWWHDNSWIRNLDSMNDD